MSRDSTMGLSPDKLARLLGVSIEKEGSKAEKNEPGCSSFELMWAGWCEGLGLDVQRNDGRGASGGATPGISAEEARDSILALLLDSESDIKTIKKLRRYAKNVASRAVEPERSLALSVYFGAIANALLFHNTKITTYSYKAMEASFSKLLDKDCVPEELFSLFTRAAKVSRKRSQ